MRSITVFLIFLLCLASFMAGDFLSDARFRYLPLCDKFGDLRVVDGDTVDCGGFRKMICEGSAETTEGKPIDCSGRMLRIADIDAPEIHRPACDREKKKGDDATKAVTALVAGGNCVVQWTGRRDSFGRYLSHLQCDGVDVGAELIRRELAVPWPPKKDKDGKEEHSWCQGSADGHPG